MHLKTDSSGSAGRAERVSSKILNYLMAHRPDFGSWPTPLPVFGITFFKYKAFQSFMSLQSSHRD